MAKKYTLHEVRELIKDDKDFFNELSDIDNAVQKFSNLMRDKMFDKAAERYSGWNNNEDDSVVYIEGQLKHHVEKADYIDVANIAMMLHGFKNLTTNGC